MNEITIRVADVKRLTAFGAIMLGALRDRFGRVEQMAVVKSEMARQLGTHPKVVRHNVQKLERAGVLVDVTPPKRPSNQPRIYRLIDTDGGKHDKRERGTVER